MHILTLEGDVTSALTYFAALGIASVAESEKVDEVRIGFTDEPIPKIQVHFDIDSLQTIGQAITDVANRWTRDESWTQVTMEYTDGKKKVARSPFSPRFKPIEQSTDWLRHQNLRWKVLDTLTQQGDGLALNLIQALGEPAYWRNEKKSPRPDEGASRWEMKTRNRGEEFILHRFRDMCKEVSQRTPEEILEGLTGAVVRDFGQRESIDSRTATGFRTPGTTDVTLAFTALIGISNFPLSHHVDRIAVTPGAFPTTSLHPRWAVLPISSSALKPARMRSILISQQLATASVREGDVPLQEAAKTWLKEREIPLLVHYQILKTGSSSAPERQILSGEVEFL